MSRELPPEGDRGLEAMLAALPPGTTADMYVGRVLKEILAEPKLARIELEVEADGVKVTVTRFIDGTRHGHAVLNEWCVTFTRPTLTDAIFAAACNLRDAKAFIASEGGA